MLRHIFWTIVTGVNISINTKIGGRLLESHLYGLVIDSDAQISVNCLIFQQVTIGGRIDTLASAKLRGRIHFGDHAKIGVNAIVLIDVPECKVTAVIRAKIV